MAGVTEPAIYGLNLHRKKPMLGVMIGGAAGGVVAGFLGCHNYTMGYSTILALPIFEDTMVGMVIAVIISITVAALVTFILGFDETAEGDTPLNKNTSSSNAAVSGNEVVAVASGNMIRIEDVKDEAFSSKMLGDGVAFEPEGQVISSPYNGKISVLMETGHAFGITREDGAEFLVHIGIDTVSLNGEGFHILAKAGDTVKAGTPIIQVDLDALKKKGFDMTTMLIVLNSNGEDITFAGSKPVSAGEIISQP